MNLAISKRRTLGFLLLASPALLFSGYVAVRRARMRVLYKPVSSPPEKVLRDVPYRKGSTDRKHRLDVFLPDGREWPVLIFVHGGGLNSGDKSLRVAGADVYANIGRFYASQGIGVAVINYRLQPGVTWRDQIDDVAHAIAWVSSYLGACGADTSRLFIGGHSAGAHLAARVALDPEPTARLGLPSGLLSGVIAVSGAGLDLTDARTYEMGQKLWQYAARFQCGDPTDNWKREASPITYITPGSPPFLILSAGNEPKSLHRQSQLLHEALKRKEVKSRWVMVPGEDHSRIVLTLSREDKTSAPAILRFIRENRNAIRTARDQCALTN